jgi:Heterokaryon incompatibility protein (HET)
MATKLTQQISSSIPIRNADLELFSYEQVPLTEETRATHIRLVYPCTQPLESSSQFSYSLELKVVPLDNSPKYEALSYTWGELPSDFPITLNGRKFYITPSLGTALLYACRGRTTSIWIDQICINQKSNEEKNAQLPLMSNIYSGATEVRIWLGEAADGSDELMDALANAGRKGRECGIETLLTRENFLRFNRWTGGVDQNDLPRRRPFLDLCQEVFPPINVDSFKAWFSRLWFHRVWTVQEFALAATPSFVCGDKSVPVDDVIYAWIMYGKSPPSMRGAGLSPVLTEEPIPMTPTPENLARRRDLTRRENEYQARIMSLHELIFMRSLTPLISIRKKKQMLDDGSGPGSSLFEVLKSLMEGRRTCAQPKDWIYGLLALPNDVKKLGIVPDYGLSAETVYSRFTRKAIENGNLEILRYSTYPKSYRSNYPSWVPDWASQPQPSTFDYADDSQILLRPGEPGLLFNASGDTKASVTNVSDEQLLALQGFVVDEIEELGSLWLGGITQSNNSPERIETLSFLSSVRLLCLLSTTKNHPIYPTPERRQEAVWRIPIADLVRVEESSGWQYNARATQAAEQELRHVLAFEEGYQEGGFSSLEAQDELWRMILREKENGARRYRDAMNNLKRKRPYITKRGYVGLGPVFARPGDKVVVFTGAAIPFVIRPVKGGYCLLGESYCDGIMDGEIVGQRKEETIVLA